MPDRQAGYYWIQDGSNPPEVAEWTISDAAGDHWIGCGWYGPVYVDDDDFGGIKVLSGPLVYVPAGSVEVVGG